MCKTQLNIIQDIIKNENNKLKINISSKNNTKLLSLYLKVMIKYT